VVIIPVADRHLDYAQELVEKLRSQKVRAVIDDRGKTVGWKVREAAKQWIPYVAVIGDKEVKEGFMTVTLREESKPNKPKSKAMKLDLLVKTVRSACLEKPFQQLSLPVRISLWPIFI
ncbi:MAG: His/Gly/Thr/Pro-type tRNA ligase C-terminal domain-containing protein, partial [Promethearchaeota archaeon]